MGILNQGQSEGLTNLTWPQLRLVDGGLFRVCWCPGGEQAGVRGSEVGKEIQQEFLDTSLAAWLWRFFVEFFFSKTSLHTHISHDI